MPDDFKREWKNDGSQMGHGPYSVAKNAPLPNPILSSIFFNWDVTDNVWFHFESPYFFVVLNFRS